MATTTVTTLPTPSSLPPSQIFTCDFHRPPSHPPPNPMRQPPCPTLNDLSVHCFTTGSDEDGTLRLSHEGPIRERCVQFCEMVTNGSYVEGWLRCFREGCGDAEVGEERNRGILEEGAGLWAADCRSMGLPEGGGEVGKGEEELVEEGEEEEEEKGEAQVKDEEKAEAEEGEKEPVKEEDSAAGLARKLNVLAVAAVVGVIGLLL